MSANEIIDELDKLTPQELRAVKARVDELTARAARQPKSVWDVFEEFSGQAQGLPPDFAENHDHYLYGTPKRKP